MKDAIIRSNYEPHFKREVRYVQAGRLDKDDFIIFTDPVRILAKRKVGSIVVDEDGNEKKEWLGVIEFDLENGKKYMTREGDMIGSLTDEDWGKLK